MIHLISLPAKSSRNGRAWCPGGLTRPLWLGEEGGEAGRKGESGRERGRERGRQRDEREVDR